MQSQNSCLTQCKQPAILFSPARLEDKEWVDRILRLEDAPSADFCFTNILIWDDRFRQQVAALGDRLAFRLMSDGIPFYAFPVGQGDLTPVIEALVQDAAAYGVPLEIRAILEKHRMELEAAFPGRFDFSLAPDSFDYVYEIEKLATLAGKKLHAKRNHINRFIENNPVWSFEPITVRTLPACALMSCEWSHQHQNQASFYNEIDALRKTFDNFEALGLEGGLLRLENRVIAFTIGEQLNSDTYIVHFEKAFSDIQGAYPLINREFARHIQETHPHIRYINREEDMGIESLQKAKKSYYPDLMMEKYTAVWRDQ